MTVTIPLHITIRLGAEVHAAAPAEKLVAPLRETDYSTRPGYAVDFLGLEIPLPEPVDMDLCAPVEGGGHTLHYQHFSLVMHRRRRLALFTAANTRTASAGLGTNDTGPWLKDPRVQPRHQLPGLFFRRDRGAFVRRHLVRREDVAWGESDQDVEDANGDIFHTTNCVPQVAALNRAEREDHWGDLERHVAAQVKNGRLTIFAGPVLADDDPTFVGVDDEGPVRLQIPRQYWKVIVAEDAGTLRAFAFVLRQVEATWRRHMMPVAALEKMLGALNFAKVVVAADQAGTVAGQAVRRLAAIELESPSITSPGVEAESGMATIYVIHGDDADVTFIRDTLTRPLPSSGFSRWVSSQDLRGRSDRLRRVPDLMLQCQAILAVVSRASMASAGVREEFRLAVESERPAIIVQTYPMTEGERQRVMPGFWSLPIVDFTEPGEAAWRELTALLPAVDPSSAESTDAALGLQAAERIQWNEEVFSARLAETLVRHDHNRAEALVQNFARHTAGREYPYPAPHAAKDLGTLRRNRQFKLMQQYGEAAIASGTRSAEVRRQFAQSLIELGMFPLALDVLQSIISDVGAPASEIVEARGLIGRVYKQQYGDAPDAPGAPTLLHRAITAYASVYREDATQLWHGINAVSLIRRAHRDGLADVDLAWARETASQILARIEHLEQSGQAHVWDYATRVEALIALGEYDAASAALDDYIKHPATHAFEVSSTYRQFDHVLQLGDDEQARGILERLWQAVERHRAPGFSPLPAVRPAGAAESLRVTGGEGRARALLIRVTDPDWNPGHIVDLDIEARLGTIVSARGSEASIKGLLGDAKVISVNESRAGGVHECDRSVPFIRVAANYPGSGGPYVEKGSGALIAVIDDGIDVLHDAFLDDAGRSRILAVWDQRDPTGPPPAGFKLGTYHDADSIGGYVRVGQAPPGLMHKPTDSGHGTHVTSIAAGRAVGNFAGGVAPEAKLLVVISASRQPIGYSASHVAALAFIDAEATRLNLPVVVNVSQGMNAGAHDGKSELEVAFVEFSKGGRKPGRVIVKSAGNERAKGGHAKVTVTQGGLEDLRWTRDAGASPGERLELWWDSADELEFRLIAPNGGQTPWINTAAAPPPAAFAGGVSCLIQIVKRHIDNGDSHAMIAIDDAVGIAAGTWQLDLVGIQVQKGGEVHAWIERGTGVPSTFQNHASEEMTISIPGTAQNVITVGAVDAANPIKVGAFSSYGPTRDGREKPEVAAPGVNVKAARAGTRNDAVAEDGTSMAAPHVTGAIALLLSRMACSGRPISTSTQIASALRQKTRNYTARWDRGQGYGVIDVAALLAAF